MIARIAAVLSTMVAIFGAGLVVGANTFGRPASVIHVVTLKWKPESTPEQQKAALDGLEKMAGQVPGIKNIWLRPLKVQSPDQDFTNAFAIEFENKAAFDRYTDNPAHRTWEKLYLPLRGRSLTHDITN